MCRNLRKDGSQADMTQERRLSCFFPCGKLADQDWLPDPEGVGAEEAGAEVNMEL